MLKQAESPPPGSAPEPEVEERYAEMSHGLFPRFVMISFLLMFAWIMLELTLSRLVVSTYTGPIGIGNPTYELYYQVLSYANNLYFPFGFFLLFYLASRIRVNLGRDYPMVALSIFVGVVLGELPAAVYNFVGNPYSSTILWDLILTVITYLGLPISMTITGFAAVYVRFSRSA